MWGPFWTEGREIPAPPKEGGVMAANSEACQRCGAAYDPEHFSWSCGSEQWAPDGDKPQREQSQRCRINQLESAIAKIAGEFVQDDYGNWRLYSAPVYVLDRIRTVAMEAKGGK
jgi:hypothetical protein